MKELIYTKNMMLINGSFIHVELNGDMHFSNVTKC